MGDDAGGTVLEQPERAELGSADARRVLQHRLEHGSNSPGELEMTCSTSDVAVCCCSDSRNSLSSRVLSMAMTAWLAKFVTSSTCLSVNGRTPGVDRNGADETVFLKHRHCQQGAYAAVIHHCPERRIAREVCLLLPQVGDVQDLFRPRETAQGSCGWGRISGSRCRSSTWAGDRPCVATDLKPSPSATTAPELGLTDAGRVFQHSLEYGLQVAWRAADDLEHVGGGSLLLQDSPQLIEQAGVLDGDDGLGGKVFDQLYLLVGERAHLLAIDDDRPDQTIILEHGHNDR